MSQHRFVLVIEMPNGKSLNGNKETYTFSDRFSKASGAQRFRGKERASIPPLTCRVCANSNYLGVKSGLLIPTTVLRPWLLGVLTVLPSV